jgi:prepilin signal peptidase PulO-like enzyme (type II secretory pathway)
MIVEAITAVLFVTVFAANDVISFGFLYPALLCIFIASLIVVCFEDFDTKHMSLSVLVFECVVAVFITVYAAVSGRGEYIEYATDITLKSRIIGMFVVSLPLLVIGFVITPLFYKAFLSEDHEERRKLRKRLKSGLSPFDEKKVKSALEPIEARIKERGEVYGFGMGDVVLMAGVGLVLGTRATVVAAFVAIIIGAVYGVILKQRLAKQDTAAVSDIAAPDIAAPDIAASDIAASDTAALDTAAPDTAAPDTAAAPDTSLETTSSDITPLETSVPGFAFGPFLCMGTVIALFVGNQIADLYLRALGK